MVRISTSKYKNVRTLFAGIMFDSKKEAGRYRDLLLLERAGHVRAIRRQVRYDMIVNHVMICFYKADFVYWDVDQDQQVVEDAKGKRTAVYKLKKKLMLAIHGIEIIET